VYIDLVGSSNFNNIRLSGNVKVVFTGSGTLTLNAVQDWSYDDYSEPDFDLLSNPCSYAVSSYPTIGYNGSLQGEASISSTMPNGMVRTITEEYAYDLPEIALDGVTIAEGGQIYNASAVKGEDYFTFTGQTSPVDESRMVETPEAVVNTYLLTVDGERYNMVYNAEKTAFYVTVTSGMGPNTTTTYYDVTADIQSWQPWESYIGTADAPAAKVVLTGAAQNSVQSASATVPVITSTQQVAVNGQTVDCDRYVIEGYNYFKLRDIAAMLMGTDGEFAIDFDLASQTIYVTTGQTYTKVGGELNANHAPASTATSSSWSLMVDGKRAELTAYAINGNNYFKLRDLGSAIGFQVDYISQTNTAAITTTGKAEDSTDGRTLLQAIVIEKPMMQPATNSPTTEQYNALYKEGNGVDGVNAILAAGQCSINGIAIPGTEADFDAQCPDGYLVNGSAWLTKTEEGWTVGRNTYDTYAEAAAATLDNLNAGLEVRLYDTDGDGYADQIDADYLEAVIVDKIVQNSDGSYSVYRADIDSAEEKAFDAQHFTADSGETISAANFDTSIQEGDMGLFWYGADGWHMSRPVAANGILVDGEDHGSYNIDGVEYQDAMRFSRDNIVISNRCGEFVNAHKYFGFNNNSDGLKITLWIVPTLDDTQPNGAPAGFTDENAPAFLAKAIAFAQAKLDAVTVSADGKGVSAGQQWATQEACDELSAAITRAQGVLDSGASNEICDYQVYLLYLHLHGSADDIGAAYAGYDFVGFDNQVTVAQ
jgi:hypothetical protein